MTARAAGVSRRWRPLHAAWWVVCVAALAALIGTRWIRYTGWSASPRVHPVASQLMILDAQAFLWPWAYTRAKLPSLLLVSAVLLVGLHRRLPAHLVRRAEGRWRLTPMAVSLLLAGAVWGQYLFDLNPTVGAACAASVLLGWLLARPALARLPGWVLAVAWLAFFGGWILAAADVADRVTLVVWALLLLASHRLLAPHVGGRELVAARLAGVIAMNLFAAVLPLAVPLHGGTYLGEGSAYDFCENATRGALYASVPTCDSIQPNYPSCAASAVVEYDRARLTRIATHRFFAPEFYGRLETIACLPDEIQVSVQAPMYRGQPLSASVLRFPVAAPERFDPQFTSGGLGATLAYNAERDVVVYASEFTSRLARFEVRTAEFAEAVGRRFYREWYQPISLARHTGSLAVHAGGIHPARDAVFVPEFMQGRYAYAVGLWRFGRVATYDAGGGGAFGAAVDAERDRLFVSSIWGLEVFDLATGALIARKRLGLGNRSVVVDRERNRLYVGSTVEGKVRILDRDSFDLIAQIPIGIGTRYPYLSRDGRRLFASSASAYYHWDPDTLAKAP